MIKGWMKNGPRTLAEQMLGLDRALAEAQDKTILDLGCAEGYIGMEFAKAGARNVLGIDFNMQLIEAGQQELQRVDRSVILLQGDLEEIIQREPPRQHDIVLALAILHKLRDPSAGVRFCCKAAASLIVVRLPIGSTGCFRSKFSGAQCDLRDEMPRHGFRREHKAMGPRGEWVHYYRRFS